MLKPKHNNKKKHNIKTHNKTHTIITHNIKTTIIKPQY